MATDADDPAAHTGSARAARARILRRERLKSRALLAFAAACVIPFVVALVVSGRSPSFFNWVLFVGWGGIFVVGVVDEFTRRGRRAWTARADRDVAVRTALRSLEVVDGVSEEHVTRHAVAMQRQAGRSLIAWPTAVAVLTVWLLLDGATSRGADAALIALALAVGTFFVLAALEQRRRATGWLTCGRSA